MAKETALELDTVAAGYTGGDALHFGGFPGVWAPGQPVALSELGFASDKEALARVEELGLPLREVKVDAGSAPMPARPNHLIDASQQEVLDRELAEQPQPRTHADVDQLAADAGVEFPDTVRTVAQKTAFLEASAAGESGEAAAEGAEG